MGSHAEEEKLAEMCRKCGGKCCFESITVSEEELERLRKKGHFKAGKLKTSQGEISTIKTTEGEPCPFLKVGKKKTGCVLKGRERPLSCRLFPITFLLEEGEPKFYLSKYCPYFLEAGGLEDWMGGAIGEAREELKNWSEGEKLARSFLHKRIHGRRRLVEID
ncbi:MAG: YkgJ family cysteine cluster protein [Candidatus Micrarchaeota archaeon]|nr:YkgJ family cysteine cluster protein [Candidatus Micrarchaeota archaeon]